MSRSVFGRNVIKKLVPRKFRRSSFLEKPAVANWVEKKLFDGDDLICLPRDNVIALNKSLDDPENMVLPSRVADYFVEKSSYRFIMDKCICRDGVGCKDYPIDYGCVFLGEAARGINPALGRVASVEETKEHLRRCREAGLVHFVGKSKLDTVWLKIGPGEKLFTICSCCPCCCITRGVPYAPKNLAEKVSRMPGVTVTVTDDCTGCGSCVEACFAHAISLSEDRAVISAECRGCTRCVTVCPNDAITVKIDYTQYVNSAIERLSAKVDVS